MEKRILYHTIFIFLFLFGFLEGNPQRLNFQTPKMDDEAFLVVELLPDFPFGNDSLYRFIQQNLQYPYESRRKRIQGRVFFDFIIDKYGYMTNLSIRKGINEELDKEALRIAMHIPFWLPGEHNNHKLNVFYAIPINFQLPQCEYYYANPFFKPFLMVKPLFRKKQKASNIDIECF